MLEQHTELIERLLHGSLTRTSEFNEGWTFTNDGTLCFSVWDEDGNTFFAWSERQPNTAASVYTDSDTVTAYLLTTELGSRRAMALHFDVPRFPRKIDQLHPSWTADKTQQPPTLCYHRNDDARLRFYCSSEFYGVPLTHAMQYDLEDLLKKYMA
ncbi:hypothetical protein [Schaalia odontolytica]|uniref:hypothetical protein n=1 Tax=Schaalia odontolytica TaxID=1660 RepID=UPI00211CE6C6|nr:hypothetical protein [Schaalia odontolytica]UUO93122.1 hypothetical protein NQK35_08065 [Schaalia odontolytica]